MRMQRRCFKLNCIAYVFLPFLSGCQAFVGSASKEISYSAGVISDKNGVVGRCTALCCAYDEKIMTPTLVAADCCNDDSTESSSDQFRIGYLSDIEGHWDYFLECIERSNVLDWEETENPASLSNQSEKEGERRIKFKRLVLRPNAHFIYGGDTVDKGPGDIRLVRALVSLKKRYPDRVHLLVGNRDLNKLRLSSELSEADLNRLETIEGPFWDRTAPSLKEYLEDLLLKDDNAANTRSLEQLNTRAERLRYMLKHTLGCPDTFEFRREEIQLLTQIYGEYPPNSETHDTTPLHTSGEHLSEAMTINVTDEEVVDSFLYEISPEGSLRQYLHLSSIAAIVGNTIFVHGAIDSLTMKFVPSKDTKFQLPTTPPPHFASPHTNEPVDGQIIENVHHWVDALNDYLQHGLNDFANRPVWNHERTSRGGESLLAIQNRPSMWGRSVVCNSYADGGVITTEASVEERQRALQTAQEKLDPLAFEGIASNVMDPEPSKWLLEHGIERIVVGHKPTGDSPAVLSSKYTGVEIVAVDTSYSHRRDLNNSGNESIKKFGRDRGDAIAMVEIAGNDAFNNWLETSGVLACGSEYSNQFPILGCLNDEENELSKAAAANNGDPCLGKKLSNGGWWVKAKVPPNYHLCRGSGRLVEYEVRAVQDVIDELALEN